MLMERQEKILFESEEMERAISRMAHEILEREDEGSELALVGVETRGAHLVRRIAQRIEKLSPSPLALSVGTLDVTPYRDDLEGSGGAIPINPVAFPFSLDDKAVILVDDVIYTGRTTRVALDLITQMGKPKRILVAVLVDRGDRELPIKADIVGKNVRVSEGERVNVMFREADGIDQVMVTEDLRRRVRRPNPS